MLLDDLKSFLGERATAAESVREHHAHGESYHAPAPPDVVVYPTSTDEVARIVAECARTKTPVVPFGAGTSLEGHVQALRGGVCIDVTQMNAILDVRVDDLDVTVQAGVTRLQLNEHLKPHGLFFPVDPGADATLGGMASTRASGTNAVRYGTMRDNVLGMTVVLADGRVIRTARRARKSAAGYDLTRLFVGSEGTLGIICELSVRLFGVPETVGVARCSFDDIGGAARAVIQMMQLQIPLARVELLDEVQMDACNRYSGLSEPVAPTLFLEFHGTSASVAEDAARSEELVTANGGSAFRWSADQAERTALWKARHDAYYAALAMRPGARGLVTDVCVPLSRLAECIVETKKDLADCPVPAGLVGHVGDGNFHVAFAIDPDDAAEHAMVERLHARMVERALAMDGTCTGEHGIGQGKIGYLTDELGPGVEVMRAIKRALDPDGIMNPGKVLA
jgi:D-lactate dehydrogenase (cytochrome)